MRFRILRVLSSLALVLAVVWFVFDPDFEPVITAILGLAGLLSAGFAEQDRTTKETGVDVAAPRVGTLVGPGAAPPRSVAVLPLENLSADPDDEFFSDGMTEDVITQLAKIRDLKVISRTSSMQYRHRSKSLRQIAAELGVAHVVEGSVRRDGDRLRVVAQLVDAATDQHLWSESFDRERSDVFRIQSEIATRIAAALEARLSESEKQRIEKVQTADLEAYNLCLMGRHFWNRWTEPDLVRSTEFFTRAVERDPHYARAHYELGVAWATLALGYWSFRPLDVYPKAAASLERALQLDPTLADAHSWSGLVKHWFDLDWAAAETLFVRAVELDPNSAQAHDSYGWWLTSTGRHAEAQREFERALELDPLSLFVRCNAALGAYRARSYERSVRLFDEVISLHPNLPMGHSLGALAHVKNGSPDKAMREGELADRLSEGSSPYRAMYAYALASAGESDQARALLQELEGRRERENVWTFGLAMAWAGLGEIDLAFERLEEAVRERVGWIVWLGVEPALDNLRGEPRFDELEKMVGLPKPPRSS